MKLLNIKFNVLAELVELLLEILLLPTKLNSRVAVADKGLGCIRDPEVPRIRRVPVAVGTDPDSGAGPGPESSALLSLKRISPSSGSMSTLEGGRSTLHRSSVILSACKQYATAERRVHGDEEEEDEDEDERAGLQLVMLAGPSRAPAVTYTATPLDEVKGREMDTELALLTVLRSSNTSSERSMI